MNAPHSFQGSIPADAEMVNIYLQLNSAHRHCQTVISPPPEKSNMMTSTTQWKRAHEEEIKIKQFADHLDGAEARVITRKHNVKMTLCQIKTPIFFSAEEALDAMRVNLIKDNMRGAEQAHRSVENLCRLSRKVGGAKYEHESESNEDLD